MRSAPGRRQQGHEPHHRPDPVTLDGVIESPPEALLPYMSDEGRQATLALAMASDALLLGRVTWQKLAPAWREQTGAMADRLNTKAISRVTLRASPTQLGERRMVDVPDDGPFFHGTVADLRPGELLTSGRRSNYRREVVMNHVYFTALVDGAGLAAELAAELADGDPAPRVYRVEPTGAFEDDPNVTDKKFPGNPTRSYRSREPLRVLSEVTDWTRLSPEALQAWRDRLAVLLASEGGEIVN